MKYLIIYEDIPERTRIYVVEATGKDAGNLEACHSSYCNSISGVINGDNPIPRLEEWFFKFFALLTPIYDSDMATCSVAPVVEGPIKIIHTVFIL